MQESNTPPQQTPAYARSVPLWTGFIVLALLAGGLVWFLYLANTAPQSAGSARFSPAANATYQEGRVLMEAGQYQEARAKYEEVLLENLAPEREAEVRLQIAHTVRDEENYIEAVRLYKQIVLDEAFPAISRAFAAQSVAEIAERVADPAVQTEIFSGDPFQSLLSDGRDRVSLRRLYGYAANLYPLAYSDLNVAVWYADRLRRDALGRLTPALTEPQRTEFRQLVQARLARAEVDMQRVRNSDDIGMVPEILRVRALILGSLAFADLVSHEEADKAYKDALETTSSWYPAPGDAHMRLWYATYLSSFPERSADVVALLTPLYSDIAYRLYISPHLAAERDNVTGGKRSIAILGNTDPQFKEFLLSLGWTDADFTRLPLEN